MQRSRCRALRGRLRDHARDQLDGLVADDVTARLRSTPLGALRGVAGRGVRWSALEQAGVRCAVPARRARPRAAAVPGVGAQTVQEVRRAAHTVAMQVRRDIRFRFDPTGETPPRDSCSRRWPRCAPRIPPWRSCGAAEEPLPIAAGPLAEAAERTGSRLSMLFTARATRTRPGRPRRLAALTADPRLAEASPPLASRRSAVLRRGTGVGALPARRREVNALLSTVDAAAPDEDAARGFVPEELRQRIVAVPLDTSLLSATLRGYQVFGAQYALHQGRSILGDEMGLGKTVQALAAMAHLAAKGQRRFLVVCPASVQVNWLKETAKHTHLRRARAARQRRGRRRAALAARGRRRGHDVRHPRAAGPRTSGPRGGDARRRRGAQGEEPGGRPVQDGRRRARTARPVPDRHAYGEPRRGVPQPRRLLEARTSRAGSIPPTPSRVHRLPPRSRAGLPAPQPGRRAYASSRPIEVEAWVQPDSRPTPRPTGRRSRAEPACDAAGQLHRRDSAKLASARRDRRGGRRRTG